MAAVAMLACLVTDGWTDESARTLEAILQEVDPPDRVTLVLAAAIQLRSLVEDLDAEFPGVWSRLQQRVRKMALSAAESA